MHLEGGCLCGTVRYKIADVFDVVYCHCNRCRRRTGAPVFIFVVVLKADFELLEGQPTAYRSSERGVSHFCGVCGSSLYFVEDDGPYVSVAHGGLDDPASLEPMAHQWTRDALPWLDIHDEAPRFSGGRLVHPRDRRRTGGMTH